MQRLEKFSLICRLFGFCRNRALVKDLLQAHMRQGVGMVRDVQILGKGFYHVEFDTTEAVEELTNQNPLEAKGTVIFST